MPVSILIVVDLPAPFGPINATDWPAGMLRLIPSTATTSRRVRRRPQPEVTVKVLRRFSTATLRSIAPSAYACYGQYTFPLLRCPPPWEALGRLLVETQGCARSSER